MYGFTLYFLNPPTPFNYCRYNVPYYLFIYICCIYNCEWISDYFPVKDNKELLIYVRCLYFSRNFLEGGTSRSSLGVQRRRFQPGEVEMLHVEYRTIADSPKTYITPNVAWGSILSNYMQYHTTRDHLGKDGRRWAFITTNKIIEEIFKRCKEIKWNNRKHCCHKSRHYTG